MKYSINGTGNIVAERDIYSLGGFIPKGSVGAKVANEDQISQDGECWLTGGDISTRPDIRIKDNAYIGHFVGAAGAHTDGVTEFSGNTLIPGKIEVRSLVADTKNNFFAKDSFIGVSMDVLCGPRTTATAFPFEQGGYLSTAPRGTAFSSGAIQTSDINLCRSTDAVIRCGLNTYVYLPTGYSGRVLWAYAEGGTAVYSGESEILPSGLNKISHPIYKQFMLHVNKINGTAMTPADLLASGAKILGHISRSATVDIRPESASGSYVMDKSSLLLTSDNCGLATTQQRLLAGGMYNTNMYTKTDVSAYKPYGTFRNVERLEYTKYLSDSHRTAVTRDTYISAYDCPLLRVDNTTYLDDSATKGNLVLRRCIVPKAEFQNDIINGNTYEDIDFSYANEDLGYTMTGYTRFISSRKQGIYRLSGGPSSTGFASHKGNLDPTARLYQGVIHLPLDGSIMEQGSYGGGSQIPYESAKTDSPIRVRTGKPLATFGLVFPSLPAGYSVKALYYLDDDFIIRAGVTDPTEIVTTYPYVTMLFRKDDDSAITVTDFIALNRILRIIDHTKAPEITGSAYVGAGVTVRGDIKLIGDPYVNRLLDVNLWERGTTLDGAQPNYPTWEDRKVPTAAGNRFRLINQIPVEPGGSFTCGAGYFIHMYRFDENGNYVGQAGWATSHFIPSGNTKFVGLIIKKAATSAEAGALITESDVTTAGIKYVRAFEKRRYITNELDRTSPKDILIGPDYWEQGTVGGGQTDGGKTYEELKATSGTTVRLKRPINMSPLSSSISTATGFVRFIRVLDAATKFHLGESLNSAKMALLAVIIQKDPSAATVPADITNARLVIEFTPSPRIIVPYGVATLSVNGMRIRMYDNAVLSRILNQQGEIVLQGDAVMGYDFNSGSCMCSKGHSDAIIKLP